MRAKVLFCIVALGMAFTLSPRTGSAQTPRYKETGEDISSFQNPKVVDDPAVRYAYHAELEPGKVDIYQIYAAGTEAGNPSLAVPKVGTPQDFTPAMALIGPGLPTDVTTGTLPFQLPSDPLNRPVGVKVIEFSEAGGAQSFDTSLFWRKSEYGATYPQSGPYYIAVWDKGGRGGRYVLEVGGKEQFGLLDLAKFPYTWVKQQMWFGNWPAPVIAGLLLTMALAALLFLLGKRRRTGTSSTTRAATETDS